MTDAPELLPCPSGHTKTTRDNNNIYGAWWVKCAEGECSWRTAGNTEAEAIAAWNHRPLPHPGGERVGEMVERLRALMAKANPLPWELEVEPNEDGEYGPGPDPGRGYDDFMILGSQGGKIFGTENATHKLIEEDSPDEEGYAGAWDQLGKANAELVVEAVNAIPKLIAALERRAPALDFDDFADIIRPACLGADQVSRISHLLVKALAVRPDWRDIVERCAKVAEAWKATGYMSDRERSYCADHGEEIAAAIRALKDGGAA